MSDFDQIFRQYHNSLLLYGLKFLDNKSEALDVIQEVFVDVWENKKYELPEGHLKAYLLNAVRNKCLNLLKHQKVVRKHVSGENYKIKELELDWYKSGEKSLIENENLQKIYDAIDSLSGNYKEVIQLSRFEGLKNSEISEKLNVPVRTVETRLFRALQKLREKLSQKDFFILLSFRSLEISKYFFQNKF